MRIFRGVVITFVLLGLVQSCSLKKNTAATRNYTAFITRYNIYFNGDEHYKETLKEMESKYADDYTRTLLMHPAEAHALEKATKPTGDFKRSIEKAQKAIQLRSIKKRPARKRGKADDPEYKKWLKREEYNPFLHNAWMMMARSQYMNGDFLGAASTFFYISKHFTWLPATVTEARLWQARCYCAIDWLFEAESILTRIKDKDLTNSTLEGLYYFTWADYYVRSQLYTEAIPMLEKAIKYASGAQKVRLTFLLGQMYQATGDKSAAYEAYKKAAGASNVDYRAKFNARIKQSEVYEGADIEKEVRALKGMVRQGSNKEYLDQIYYAIGNLYLSRGDTLQAIENYKEAIAKSKRQGIDMALAQVALGRLYFDRGEYTKAQPCLSSAVPQLPENYPDYALLKRRSDVLDEMAVYAESVELQDSLLRLAAMSPEQQREVVDKIIADLKKKEKEEAEARAREEYLANQRAQGDGLNRTGAASAAPSTFVMNTDKSWYFYNTGTRNAGRTEFQKRWGSRRLEDDWRRRNKATFSMDDSEEAFLDGDSIMAADGGDNNEVAEGTSKEAQERLNDPHYPEYYLRQIPKTDAEIATANEVIEGGLFNMGVILKDKLNDYPAAEREFNRLLERYPNNSYKLEVYNNLFLMYLRQGDRFMSEKYRRMILADFPDSKFAEALRGDDYEARLMASDSIQSSLYDRAYEAYMNNRNSLVHEIYATVKKDYPLSRIMPKFMFIDALTYVTENKPDKFSEILRELVERYPDVDVAPLASDYLKHLAAGRKFNSSGGQNMRGMVWSTRLTTDSAAMSALNAPAHFELGNENEPHYLVLLYQVSGVEANQLLFDVARFNFNTFTVRDFDLEPLRFGDLGMIVIKGFTSVADLSRYRSMMEKSTTFKLPQAVIPVVISEKNFNMLLSEGRSFEEYFEATNDKRLEETHRSVLPEEDFPSAAEMYAPVDEDTIPMEEEEDPEDASRTPSAEIEEDEFDIPNPPMPEGKPAVSPTRIPGNVPPPPKPKETPKQKPVPPAPKPMPLPEYPEGSEGDDPLLD